MLWVAVGIPKVKVPQVNRQRHRGAQHTDGIPLVDRKITQHKQASERAAFPEAERNHALPRPFRSDPLNEKTQAENQAAGQSYDFPRMNHDSEDVGLSEKLKAVHKETTFRQISEGDQLFVTIERLISAPRGR
jgi:hypothetical protein